MSWECSECGYQVERSRPLAICNDYGTAGAILTLNNPMNVEGPDDDVMAAWTRVGFERDMTSRDSYPQSRSSWLQRPPPPLRAAHDWRSTTLFLA
jgi:hypothetical protein